MNIKKRWKLVFTILVLLFLTTPVFALSSWNNTRISSKDAVASYPQLSSGNHSYGVVWVDDRNSNSDLYFSQINRAGKKAGKETRVTNNSVHDLTPALVWNGTDYGVFWSYSQSQIYFTRISENGDKLIGDILTVTDTAGYAIHISAVWNGEEYGVVWWDARNAPPCTPSGTRGRAFFVRVNKDGQKIGNEIPVSDAFSNPWQDYKPLLVWDGENYAVFWSDSRENGECAGGAGDIFMSKVNKDGEKILGDIKLQNSSTNSNLSSVVWDGSNYALAYNVGTSMFAKIDTAGNTLISDIPINTDGFSGSPKIAWDGSNYIVSWFSNRDRTPDEFYNNEIYYSKLDTNGIKVIPETRITFQKDPSMDNTQIVFLKENTSIAWLDYRDGSPQIYFSKN